MNMRKFLEGHELEALSLLVILLALTRWWMPPVTGYENVYAASHWALSYDGGLIRRGLVGTIARLWMPVVTIEGVRNSALVLYCAFVGLLLAVSVSLLRTKEYGGRLFRLILFFVATPVTLALCAHDLGRFDLFLVVIAFICMTVAASGRHLWVLPLLMTCAMFVHESFLILWAPTLFATLIFVWLRDGRKLSALIPLLAAVAGVGGAFIVLLKFGTPAAGYEEFTRQVQSRADFRVTELSMREAFYSITDHMRLASSSLYDPESLVNLALALIILSPAILILARLWKLALANNGESRVPGRLLLLATMSGLVMLPIATDYGRWLSAIIFCNIFTMFLFVKRDIVRMEELDEFGGGYSRLLFLLILVTYLLFGPFHDWEPYPYRQNMFASACSIAAVLLFDVAVLVGRRRAVPSVD